MDPAPIQRMCPMCGHNVQGTYVPGGKNLPYVPTWRFHCTNCGHDWTVVVRVPDVKGDKW
jgi:hypothetical protein